MNYREELNKEQYEAVTYTDGPLLVLAGAGTGKTRTLVYRTAYLIERGVNPENILLLTFTNKAADEMTSRICDKAGLAGNQVSAYTYHSFCAKMLRDYAEEADLDPHFTIISGSDETDIVDLIKSSLGMLKLMGFPKSNIIVNIASTMINTGKDFHTVMKEQYGNYSRFENEIETLINEVREYKSSNFMLGYDDIMESFYKLLLNEPSVRKEISGSYHYIMIDEFQDTNKIQNEIIALLCEENKNLCVVGDDLQCLYQFRGAEIENILNFPDQYPGTHIVKLTQNYRSTQEILNLSNYISRQATEGIQKELYNPEKQGPLPSLLYIPDMPKEAAYVAGIIKEKRKTVPDSEICVLARNSFQTYDLETILTSKKIPYHKYGGKRFLDQEHIKDILAYMRLYTNPRDEISWFRILQLHDGIGMTYSREIASGCKDWGLEYLINPCHQKKPYAKELCILYKKLDAAAYKDFHAALYDMIEFYLKLKQRKYLNETAQDKYKRAQKFELLSEQRKDLESLIEIAYNYVECSAFLDDLSLEKKRVGECEEGITISTVHSAKGLEFEVVIILDCVNQLFPNVTSEDYGTKLDNEELRCFYVAVTRAKNELYLIKPNSIIKFGRQLYTKIAHYLEGAELQARYI